MKPLLLPPEGQKRKQERPATPHLWPSPTGGGLADPASEKTKRLGEDAAQCEAPWVRSLEPKSKIK